MLPDLYRLTHAGLMALIYWVVATTTLAIFFVSFQIFNALAVMVLGLVTVTAIFWWVSDSSDRQPSGASLALLVLVLVVSLFLRLEPSKYVLGAQDQGLYLLKAEHFLRQGGNRYIDKVRRAIENPAILEYYDEHNHRDVGNESVSWFERGRYEGLHYLGLYISDLEASEYVFQFYPVHSIWLANFSALFGAEHGTWATVFFGLLTIILAFFLVFEVSGSSAASLATGSLFAVNALHVFFSRFPVSEITALAFFLMFLFFLVRYANQRTAISLLFSAIALTCYFFTRISGFIVLPFILCLMGFAVIGWDRDQRWPKSLTGYCLLVVFGFILSLAYGYTQTYPYFRDIFVNAVGGALGSNWQAYLIYGCVGIVTTLIIARMLSRELTPFSDYLLRNKSKILTGVLIVVTTLAIYKTGLFAFTNQYLDSVTNRRWQNAGLGVDSLRYSTMYVFGLTVTPPGLILFFWGLVNALKRESVIDAGLVLMFLLFWAYIAVVMMITPYLYYYGRYQISELIPLALIFAGMSFNSTNRNRGRGILGVKLLILALALGISLYQTSYQYKGQFAEGSYESLRKIDEIVKSDDLLLIKKGSLLFQEQIVPSLDVFFGMSIFQVGHVADLSADHLESSDLFSKFESIYVLSDDRLPEDSPGVTRIEDIAFRKGYFGTSRGIPESYRFRELDLSLYKLDKDAYANQRRITLTLKIEELSDALSGFTGDNWTKGCGTINRPIEIDSAFDKVAIQINGWRPHWKDIDKVNPRLLINGKPQRLIGAIHKGFVFDLNDLDQIEEIKICAKPFVPRELGVNNDTRSLGLDVRAIRFYR